MSRRIAIACAALLSTAVIASGSANAKPAPADAGIAQLPDVVTNEIAVDLDSASPNHNFDGNFIELHNTSSSDVDLGDVGYELSACSSTGSLTEVVLFQSGTDVIPAGEFFLIGDTDFAGSFGGPLDIEVPSLNLDQSAGGMLLEDTSVGLVDAVKWGTPSSLVCNSFPDAGVTPDDDNSLQRNTTPPPTWCTLPPGTQNPSC